MITIDDAEADSRALFTIEQAGAGSAVAHPSPYCRGPWDHGILHGGPVVGLAGWAAEEAIGARSPLRCARLTVELRSAVPVAPLRVEAAVVKPGRRSAVVEVTGRRADTDAGGSDTEAGGSGGTVLFRATSQWTLPTPGFSSAEPDPPPRPEEAADPGAGDFDYPRPGFNCDAAELRYTEGSNEEAGPGTIWVRLTSPLVAGRPTTPFASVATIADLAAAAGWERSPSGTSYINADVSLQLTRYPQGPWIAIEARAHRHHAGLGYNQAQLYDDAGTFGLVLQSLVGTDTILS